MRQSTEHEKNAWLGRCRYAKCEKPTIACTICGRPGHVTLHVDSDSQRRVEKYIADVCFLHAHFLEAVDAGRNIKCFTRKIVELDESDVKHTWRIKLKTRQRLLKEYEGLFKK